MDKDSAPNASGAMGFALVEVLSMVAILSVIATIVFFMFVANAVESESEVGGRQVPHSDSPPLEPWLGR